MNATHPVQNPAEPSASAAPVPRRSLPRRAWDAMLLTGRLNDARQRLASTTPDGRRALSRALHLMEAVDRLHDPVDPLSTGSGDDVAMLLCRDAVLWALRARGIDAESLQAAWDSADSAMLLQAAGPDPDVLRGVRASLLRPSSEDALVDPKTLHRDVELARELFRGLVSGLVEAPRRVNRLRLLRFLIVSATVLLVLGAVAVPSAFAIRAALRRPDLAPTATWRTSSVYPGYNPKTRVTDGHATDLFFHTAEEQNPWIEYDLGSHKTIREVVVRNRTDCCGGRAVPLVVEVSSDRVKWTQVARRDAEFGVWSASFAPVEAYYVRLRVDRKTWFHLEGVEIR